MNNTYGTHVLLEAARKAGTIKRFINVSTDEVYGETSLGKEQGEHVIRSGFYQWVLQTNGPACYTAWLRVQATLTDGISANNNGETTTAASMHKQHRQHEKTLLRHQ